MRSYLRLLLREPLGIFAILWPLVFLAPVVPGLPKAWLNGLPWRQEFVIALLLAVTFFLVNRRAVGKSNWQAHISTNERLTVFALLIFLLWSCSSSAWAQGWLNAVHYSFTWAAYLSCFILMIRVADESRLLLVSLVSLAIALVIISIASTVEFWSASPDTYQSSLLLRRSVGLGEPFAVSVPLFTVATLTVRSRRAALICGVTAILGWLATLQTLERTPFIALTVGLVLMVSGLVIKKSWRPKQPKRVFVLLTLTVITTLAQTFTSGSDSSVQRVQKLDQADAPAQVRLLVWAVGLEMLRDHPILGVGAGNYELAYPHARRDFSAKNPQSALVNQQEDLLAQRAHNEYIQILAELGIVGFGLFLLFCAGLVNIAIKALRQASNPLALGAVCSMATFAISSGASSVSFRWFGSGLLFFFLAAVVFRFASKTINTQEPSQNEQVIRPSFSRGLAAVGIAFALAFVAGTSVLGVASSFRAAALSQAASVSGNDDVSGNKVTEDYFTTALRWNPFDAPTRFDYGTWLYGRKRYQEAVQHLRFAVDHGFNSSTCYAFLAGTQAAAGDVAGAEQTLAYAVSVYPQSVFLRVRHSIALAEAQRAADATQEYEAALSINRAAARGWRHLMCFGADSAYAAAQTDKDISPPMQLMPQSWAYPAIAEHAARPPFAYPPDIGSQHDN